jgi:uncharacterized protein (DUF1800 family)
MKRRKFLSDTLEVTLPEDEKQVSRQPVDNPFANKILPTVERTNSGLEPYAGPWGFDQVAHLLRRTMFSVRKSDITAMMSHTLDEVVTMLLANQPTPPPPLNVSAADTGVPVGQTWVNAPKLNPDGTNPNSQRNQSLKAWWIGLMVNQPVSLLEKMTLFWHNHFVTETVETQDARYSYKYNALLRQYAFGNSKDLTRAVTIEPAMLQYLNGNTNSKTNPNENYGRELQELFTIGKGPEIAPGNYTNYTEDDVKAAARVLTGWRNDATNITSYFTLSRHDTGNKQFSADYGNTVITGSTDATGMTEINALLDMIFNQQETAKFLCRKLYRYFVYYVIDPATETNVIEPLANILRTNNYEVKPVLQTLFKSAHFFDAVNVGCIIKNPVEINVGTCRLFSVQFPDAVDYVTQYDHWKYLRTQAASMQMDLGDPPNVAGWASYYQIPQYYELWINSDTLPKRTKFTDTLVTPGYRKDGFTLIIDPLAFANQISNPSDPNIIVSEFAQLLFPLQITDTQKTFLKNTLIPGLPDYEWTAEWNAYVADPTNQTKRNAVKSKLQELLSFMMSMAEYQLT